jgi:ribonuclease P protein component
MAPHPGLTERTGRFSRGDRVLKRPEYQSIYQRCAPMYTEHLVFYACPGQVGRRRLGCTVPKKVGKAVVRNRVKRLCKEAFRITRASLPEGCTLIVNAKRSAAELTFAKAMSAFARIAERLGREGYPPCAA